MKVAIIGCTHAGIAAMNQCLKYYPQTEITVYERSKDISYLSCATYLHIGGSVDDLGDVSYANPEEFVKKGVKMQMEHDVIKIDTQAHTILAQDLKTKEFVHDKYDKLIMATGSITSIPVIAGIENPKVMLCKTRNQAQKLHEAAKGRHIIGILGGGYAGVEMAEGFVKSGHEVVLFQRNKQLLDEYMDSNISNNVKSLLKKNGVSVLTDTTVTRFDDTSDNQIKITTKQNEYLVDMVAICPGVLPQSDLLKGQVQIAKNGAIITNQYMETSNPDIFAAGDVTQVHYNPTLNTKYIPLASHAIRQGNIAGMNLFKRRMKSMGTQATTGMLIFGHTVACTGLTFRAAQKSNFDAQHVFFTSNYRPNFMPTNNQISIDLIYDRISRRVLGAQLMSKHEISQSANTVSVIIQNNNTIDELAYVDMLFSPNFDEPFNYLNLVAQKAIDKELTNNK
ncbi:FAD-dependent oxidoreductase [Companilactobacillus alimentarius]|uniref:FAD-dependent oxidoreductase n=1 Tax=Companilactobacillus alimentarius TaxID=1602 RepID=UPI0028B6360F|nr:FAD-dependent oxidoreductase [Companilactobacillus alimentarius]MDT6951375.1 FAD-dependent oxidoreductase [Companilactobacillus alimentarius]